jgi:hypothetical protein
MNMLPLPEDAQPPTGKIEYRPLNPAEIESVRHVFESANSPMPQEGYSTFIGALQDNKVIGFIVLQLKLHAEPMWIEQGHSEVFQPIVKAAEKHILRTCGPQWTYLFAPAGRISQLAQTMGMQIEPWVVLSKLVMPEIPTKPHIDLLEELPTEGVQ